MKSSLRKTPSPTQVSRYGISTRVGGIYREIAFDGTVLRQWPRHVVLLNTPGELEELQEQAHRMAFTLGYPT